MLFKFIYIYTIIIRFLGPHYLEDDYLHEIELLNQNKEWQLKSSRTWNLLDFIERVRTYTIKSWCDKPVELQAPICAKYGWGNVGKDILECVYCKERIVVDKARTEDIDLSTLTEELLLKPHKEGCFWLKRNFSLDIYRVPAQVSETIFKGLKTYTKIIDPYVEGLDIKLVHGLVSIIIFLFYKVILTFSLYF